MIDRRKLMIGAIAATLPPFPARAKSRPLLAALFVQSATGPTAEIQNIPFRAAIAKHGWVLGDNIDIAERFAEGRLDRLAQLAAELVALRPDVIFTHTGNAAHAVAKATQSIPVVVGPATEESLLELAGDLARPRANVTGLTFVSQEMHEKCIELLAQIHPGARRIAVLVDPRIAAYQTYPAPMQANLGKLGLTLLRIEAPGGAPGIDAAMRSLAAANADALLVLTMPGFNDPVIARAIVQQAAALKIPVVAAGEFYAREGGLLAFGPDYVALVRRGAVFVDRILRGAKPADLPVERPTVFRLVVNKTAASTFGIAIPPPMLMRADEVIE